MAFVPREWLGTPFPLASFMSVSALCVAHQRKKTVQSHEGAQSLSRNDVAIGYVPGTQTRQQAEGISPTTSSRRTKTVCGGTTSIFIKNSMSQRLGSFPWTLKSLEKITYIFACTRTQQTCKGPTDWQDNSRHARLKTPISKKNFLRKNIILEPIHKTRGNTLCPCSWFQEAALEPPSSAGQGSLPFLYKRY